MCPLVWRGWKTKGRHNLSGQDVPRLPGRYGAREVHSRANEEWTRTRSMPTRKGPWLGDGGRVLALMWRLWRYEMLVGSAWCMLQGVCNTVCKPLLLKYLVEATQEQASSINPDFYVVLIAVALITEGVAQAQAKHWFIDRLGAAYLSSVATLLHVKAGRLQSSPVETNATALLANDVMKTFENLKILGQLPMSIASLFGGVVVLLWSIGLAGLVGLVAAGMITGVSMKISKMVSRVEKHLLKATSERISVLTQIVEGIRPIKLSAWEGNFIELLISKRAVECKHVMTHRTLHMMNSELGRANPVLSACFAFVCLGASGHALKAGDIFAAVTVFQALRLALIMIPVGMSHFATLCVVASRLEAFLCLPEADVSSNNVQQATERNNILVDLQMADFSWQGSDGDIPFRLRAVCLQLRLGDRVAVIGAVASGKSSLFHAILGDMKLTGGKLILGMMRQPVAFVPQKAFVLSGTIAENILVGRDRDETKLRSTLQAAQLTHDISTFPLGLETVVGERGVTLSGGQQQRLSIARALYGKPALLIADDPLAAVDTTVAAGVFAGIMAGGSDRAILMSLNQLHLLQHFSWILQVADGTVSPHTFPKSNCPVDEIIDVSSSGRASTLLDGVDRGLVIAEKKRVGAVRASVWRQYIAGMGFGVYPACWVLCLVSYTVMAFGDRWLAAWVEADEEDGTANTKMYLSGYVCASLGFVTCLIATSVSFSAATVRSGRTLHNDCVKHVLCAPMSWFEGTPAGRIVSRFASDLSMVDNSLSHFFEHFVHFQCTCIVLIVVIIMLLPAVAVVTVPSLLSYGILLVALDRFQREMKRLANSSMAPLLGMLTETSSPHGRLVLRSMDCTRHYIFRFAEHLDEVNRYNFLSNSVINYGQLNAYIISCIISCTTAIWVLHGPQQVPPSLVGLALTYTFMLPYFLLYLFFTMSIVAIAITCLERLLEYREDGIPQEPLARCTRDPDSSQWPSQGAISFADVTLVYRPGLPPALHNVSFSIGGAEKIGIVGRTGAGKSSIATVLFRVNEVTSGRITVDGVDISTVGLQTLRGALAIVPQEPLLISGTLRDNLDPFSIHGEVLLQEVLQRAGLQDLPLTTAVGKDAATLSCGQRQLVVLARLLLRSVMRVCLMDEPTAQVDMETDAAVQRVLKEVLTSATLLTIAHRLATVIHVDRIFVMDAGNIVEQGPPEQLLRDSGSQLSAMARATALESQDATTIASI